MVPPAQRQRGKIGDLENSLLYLGAASIAAGANSPWPIDADSRAVTVIVIIIAIIVRRDRSSKGVAR